MYTRLGLDHPPMGQRGHTLRPTTPPHPEGGPSANTRDNLAEPCRGNRLRRSAGVQTSFATGAPPRPFQTSCYAEWTCCGARVGRFDFRSAIRSLPKIVAKRLRSEWASATAKIESEPAARRAGPHSLPGARGARQVFFFVTGNPLGAALPARGPALHADGLLAKDGWRKENHPEGRFRDQEVLAAIEGWNEITAPDSH